MAEASHEALNCKTLYLKVSIHCEGCKKKVRRVLQKTEGVYNVDIDSFQHKVTVKCNVDHDTLIRKLLKSGKQASVWPETKNPMPANMSNDTKNQNKESNSKPKNKEPKESSENPNSKEKQPEPAKGDEKEKEKEKPKNEDETKSKPQEKEKEKEKDIVKEKPKEKEKEKEKAKEQLEQEVKPNSEGGEKKKEKKEEKEKKNESSGKEGGQHVEKGIGSGPLQPKQEFMYQPYPYSYPYPPARQPIMSYHAAQPSSSQAYYQQPPMPGTQGYMYQYPETNPYQYQHQYQSPYQYQYGAPSEFSYGTTESSTRGEDHLSYFNEENANSCSVM